MERRWVPRGLGVGERRGGASWCLGCAVEVWKGSEDADASRD